MGVLSVSQVFMGFLRVIRVNLIPGIVGLNGIQSCFIVLLVFKVCAQPWTDMINKIMVWETSLIITASL